MPANNIITTFSGRKEGILNTAIKNTGDTSDSFRLFLFGHTGKEISHVPDTSWLPLQPDEQKTIELNLNPRKITLKDNGQDIRVELRKFSAPNIADIAFLIPVASMLMSTTMTIISATSIIFTWVVLPRIILRTPFPRIACWNKQLPHVESQLECPFVRWLAMKKIRTCK